MDWVVFGVQWLHILLGILWFGSALHNAAILIPAISSLPIPTQREVGSRIGERASPLISVVAPAVIVLGFVRGTSWVRSRGWMTCSTPPTASRGWSR